MKKIKLLSILLGLCMSISLFTACDLSGLINVTIPDDGNPDDNTGKFEEYTTTRNGKDPEMTEEESHLHKVEIEEGFAPTCTEYGKTDGSHCTICGEKLSEPELIPPTGHDFDKYGQCKICGEYFADTGYETTEPSSETESETVYETESETPDVPWWEYETREPTVGLAYKINDEGNGYIVYEIGKATDKDIVIPSEYNGLPVVKIDTKAFKGYDITSVYIPDTVKKIGGYAFQSCDNLNSVYIPGTVASMGVGAFSSCSSLKEVTLGEGIEHIPYKAFSYAYSLREIVIPESVTRIDSYAFSYCSSLERITISSGSMLESISKDTFEGCDKLQYNTYSNASYLGSEDNPYMILVKADNQKIRSCEIHSQTKAIAGYAFEGCSSIKTMQIPDGVKSVGYGAFRGCTSLESVTMPLVREKIENGLEVDMSFAEYFGGNVPKTLKTVVINGGDKIGDYAFSDCTGLTSITIPDGVTSIGEYAFSGCTGLTSITIPDGVTSIDAWAFSGCSGLTSITIPDSVISIGRDILGECNALESVTMPLVGKKIENGLEVDMLFAEYFGGNIPKKLKTVVINGGDKIGDSAFSGCSGITSITLPDSVTSIGREAFSNCTGITSITLPDSVTSIGDYAFQSCTGLTSITIPDGVTSIGGYAFQSCTGLTSITIPDGVTSIGEWAFAKCVNLTDIYFGGSEAEWQTLTSGHSTNFGAYNAMVHFAGEEETQPEETEPSAD